MTNPSPVNNPLVQLGFDIPFSSIRSEHIEPAVSHLISLASEAIESIAHSDASSYELTLGALEKATEPLELALTVLGHLESVATTPEFREAYNRAQPKASEFFSKIPLNEGLFKTLCKYAATESAKTLEPIRARHLRKTLEDFRRNGARLGSEGKKRIAEIDVELSKLTTEFAQNVLDSTNAFELNIEDVSVLDGLPESALAAAKQSAEEQGKTGYRFTLQAPSLIPLLTYLHDQTIREKVWREYNTRATGGKTDNRTNIRRILMLRQEKAKLLGYANFPDFVLFDRMAKSGEKAFAFVKELHGKTFRAFEAENQELAAYRRELEGENAPDLAPWDVGYYSEKLRKQKFDFDEEEIRTYFPVDSVVDGLFLTAKRLYGVEITERKNANVWDSSVRTFELAQDNQRLGTFYLDLHPRDNKRGGAWMNGLITGVKPKPHLGLFCANVSPSVAGKPGLLRHREVETLFHEFGHLLHHLLTEVSVRSLAGTNVAWDFVELPSQIMENWCWEREALDLFARHFETGDPIPEELFQKMVRARTFRAANAQMRQLGFASVDLALHQEWDETMGDPVDLARQVATRHASTPLPENYSMITAFTHLFAGPVAYASGYYSYKWAEVLDADAFSRFQKEGLFNPEVGNEFRRTILSQGDAKDPMDLFRDFMGREPELEPLLRRSGLSQPG